MNSITVLKKSFSWKFGYSKFQKKGKLRFEKNELEPWEQSSSLPVGCTAEDECWESGSDASNEDIYSSVNLRHESRIYENSKTGTNGSDPVYQNTGVPEHMYYNFSSPLSDNSGGESDEHIYEHVNTASPVNVFLTLLQGSDDAIRPDPNIYEVPPGAILHTSDLTFPDHLVTSFTPPDGFKDYENLSWNNQQSLQEELLSLPVEAIYSTVVKPKRKRTRPAIPTMLHKKVDNSSSANCEVGKQNMGEPVEAVNVQGNPATCDKVIESDTVIYENSNCYGDSEQASNGNSSINEITTDLDAGMDSSIITDELHSSVNDYENVVIADKDARTPKVDCVDANVTCEEDIHRETKKLADSVDVSVTTGRNATQVLEELAPVIEISDDGTWETKALTEAEMEQVKHNEQTPVEEKDVILFSTHGNPAAEAIKLEHAALAYGSQYYVNCPAASVKPMNQSDDTTEECGVEKQEQHPQKRSLINEKSDDDSERRRNIGAQIMKQYEQERQKAKEVYNLPDVSLLDVDASLEDIQRERRRIIDNQAVRAKRIDSWIREGKQNTLYDQLDVISSPDELSGKVKIECWSTNGDLPDGETDNDAPVVHNPADERPDETDAKYPGSGEVVYDSILQNKHKTKSYWEQLMMAAATSEQPKVQYHNANCTLSVSNDISDGKPSSDVSEQEYFDAQSQTSLHSLPEPADSLDSTEPVIGPKIVETVAKKLLEVRTHDGMERESRLQRSGPGLETSLPNMPTPAEAKIALELREMREREDELRRLRQQLCASKEDETTDDNFNSIPNTDEGNFSEYGSEEKEFSIDGNSRMVSPEVPAGGSFSHQRTQSLDSMSSGHSSGSTCNAEFPLSRRRVVVKPLDEPADDDMPTYMRSQKETPIEREIRLAREREEELRREKGLSSNATHTSPTTNKQEVRRTVNHKPLSTNDSRSVQHRLATSRIQQEINEATEREKELRAAGIIQTMSEETVDSKVTRFTDLAEYAIEERDRKLQKSVSTSNLPTSVSMEFDGGAATVTPQTTRKSTSPFTPPSGGTSVPVRPVKTLTPGSTKKFSSAVGQKGLMQRFLASRGKVNAICSTRSPSNSILTPVVQPPVFMNTSRKSADLMPNTERQISEEDHSSRIPVRRGYQSAEEKIQAELQEMEKRERELKLQRARTLARSQPNLLFIGDDDDIDDNLNSDLNKPATLRNVLSNPNLIDSEDTAPLGEEESSLEKTPHRNIRKRSALIAEWENRIQKNIDH